MDVNARLMEKLKQFEDTKTRLGELSKQIGALTEQQRAIYNQGLELKGAIDTLVGIQEEEAKKLAESKTAGLTLPVGVKPIVPEAAPVVKPGFEMTVAPEAAKVPTEVQ